MLPGRIDEHSLDLRCRQAARVSAQPFLKSAFRYAFSRLRHVSGKEILDSMVDIADGLERKLTPQVVRSLYYRHAEDHADFKEVFATMLYETMDELGLVSPFAYSEMITASGRCREIIAPYYFRALDPLVWPRSRLDDFAFLQQLDGSFSSIPKENKVFSSGIFLGYAPYSRNAPLADIYRVNREIMQQLTPGRRASVTIGMAETNYGQEVHLYRQRAFLPPSGLGEEIPPDSTLFHTGIEMLTAWAVWPYFDDDPEFCNEAHGRLIAYSPIKVKELARLALR